MHKPNGGYRHREQIGASGAGRNLCAHLALRFDRCSADQWAERISLGQVFLDERVATGRETLRAGQWLVWARPPWIEPEVPLATAILFEDADLVAVAKPSSLPTLPAGGEFLEHTLLALVRRRHPEASPMHRLGRGTSGLMVFARGPESRSRLQAAFREPGTRKVYRALCQGEPEQDYFEIESPIGEVPYGPLGQLHAATPQGRPSLSRVTVLERRGDCTLLDVEILTGRPHQIRIHLAFAGHPLQGDPLYGPGGIPLPGCQAVPGDPGYLLHAHRLDLNHPRSGERLHLICQPPPTLRPNHDG